MMSGLALSFPAYLVMALRPVDSHHPAARNGASSPPTCRLIARPSFLVDAPIGPSGVKPGVPARLRQLTLCPGQAKMDGFSKFPPAEVRRTAVSPEQEVIVTTDRSLSPTRNSEQSMIPQFAEKTGLLLIDVQDGVDDLQHWGGPTGRRNNPAAEGNIKTLLDAWRAKGLPVYFTAHDSREAASPLKLSEPGGAFKKGCEPIDGEQVFEKDVNSGWIGTSLELGLRRDGVHRLVVIGFFTNMCVATTVRMAGNLGYDTYLVDDACACTNRVAPDGTDYDAELIHATTVANLNGEFCTSMQTADALELLEGDAAGLARVQGNE